MQFNYQPEDQNLDFENEVRKRLLNIENILLSSSAQNDLLYELIRKDIRTNAFVSTPAQAADVSKPLRFVLCKVLNEDNTPLLVRLYGKTYDIRDRIRQFSTASWRPDIKTWEMEYTDELYDSLLQYLRSISSDVSETTIFEVI